MRNSIERFSRFSATLLGLYFDPDGNDFSHRLNFGVVPDLRQNENDDKKKQCSTAVEINSSAAASPCDSLSVSPNLWKRCWRKLFDSPP